MITKCPVHAHCHGLTLPLNANVSVKSRIGELGLHLSKQGPFAEAYLSWLYMSNL